MRGRRKRTTACCLLLMGLLCLFGCSSPSSDSGKSGSTESETGLVYERSMELQYAENFSVDYYEGGYKQLQTMDGTKLLVVPEGKETPEGLDEDVTVLKQPIQNLYLVSSSVMDIFDKLEALDTIRFSGQKAENWYVKKTATLDHLNSNDIYVQLWVINNGFDPDVIRAKGQQTKYQKINISIGHAEYYYDYEF